jgi:phage-related protein
VKDIDKLLSDGAEKQEKGGKSQVTGVLRKFKKNVDKLARMIALTRPDDILLPAYTLVIKLALAMVAMETGAKQSTMVKITGRSTR